MRESITSRSMVRNIDMVEALIFYGTASMFSPRSAELSGDATPGGNDNDNAKAFRFLPGVEDLIEECVRDDTTVIAILDGERDIPWNDGGGGKHERDVVFRMETSAAPNPRDLWEAIHSVTIQPKGFGGSSGFGRTAADPPRAPLPARCVVLCDATEKCRAARFAGTRVLCLRDNELADGVMNFDDESSNSNEICGLEYYWESINMDDIATPGSFWLNPPLPKDDEGNSVNVLSVMKSYEKVEREKQQQHETTATNLSSSDQPDVDDDDNLRLEAILMDIDPL